MRTLWLIGRWTGSGWAVREIANRGALSGH